MKLVGKTLPDLRLDVVMQQDGGVWTARCVQLALVTADSSEEIAWQRIQKMAVAQVLYALENDPEFKWLFKPATQQQIALMSTAKDQGGVTLVLQKKPVRLNKLLAAQAA